MSRKSLSSLASLHGVQTAYTDVTGRRRVASPEVLTAVLRTLDAPVRREQDAPDAVRTFRIAEWERVVEPVTVLWQGRPPVVRMRIPDTADRVACRLAHEDGTELAWTAHQEDLPVRSWGRVDGRHRLEVGLRLPAFPEPGYHELFLKVGRKIHSTRLVVAPPRAHPGHDGDWGVFIPAYALHSSRSWGGGDVRDLDALHRWVGDRGGSLVGTLPMLAAFLDRPFEPSPYMPVSRLFWNEFFLDVESLPEVRGHRSFRKLVGSPRFREAIRRLRGEPLVDYRAQYALKREALEVLSRSFFRSGGGEGDRLAGFLRRNPEAESYARFRAATERYGPWSGWPRRLHEGDLRPSDYEEESREFHLYAQMAIAEQLRDLSANAESRGTSFYLDLPLGVNPEGYDVWRNAGLFLKGISVGAPPDPFFSKGQDWGFPPTHPGVSREEHHAYFTRVLRHHMNLAGMLRIDHVMGFHRLFCIPAGARAADGVYLRYPAREFYAIAVLESQRTRTSLVGEDLGTVPREVRRDMSARGVGGMFVVQYEAGNDASRPLPAPPAGSLACVNTHDMPTFHAFWKGLDIRERLRMGLLEADAVRKEQEERDRIRRGLFRMLRANRRLDPEDPGGVLEELLAFLGSGPARTLLVTLEDLWQESHPQNVPGTGPERPNWRRKARHSLESMTRKRSVVRALKRVQESRRQRDDT